MMSFAAPLALWGAAAAGLATVLLHLLSMRRPRPRPLPTARFLPPASLPSRFRRVEPSDLGVLALRLIACAALGAAVAGPVVTWPRGGLARVIVADQSRAVQSPREVGDSVRALTAGVAVSRVIAFDSVPRLTDVEGLVSPIASAARGDLAAALVMAVREGEVLRARHDSVEFVVVSPLVAEEVSASVPSIAGAWGGGLRLQRVASAKPVRARPPDGASLPAPDDPVAAAAWSVWGGAPPHLRLVRGSPSPGDSAFAQAGGTLVTWPVQWTPAGGTAGLTAGGRATIGPFGPGETAGPGAPVAHWHDGRVAAVEQPLGAGCVRTVGVAVPRQGDAVLRPAFLALVRALSDACASPDLRSLPASALGAGSPGRAAGAPAAQPAAWLQRLLLAMAALALGAEWWLRGRPRPEAVVFTTAGRQREAA